MVHLRPGPAVALRLQTTTAADPDDLRALGLGSATRYVGQPRAFHRTGAGRWIDCAVIACPRCAFGLRRHVRFETPVLVEIHGGFTPARAFFTRAVAEQLAQIADRIDARRQDPATVRIRWRYSSPRKQCVEVIDDLADELASGPADTSVHDDLDDVDLPLAPSAGSRVLETVREPAREASSAGVRERQDEDGAVVLEEIHSEISDAPIRITRPRGSSEW